MVTATTRAHDSVSSCGWACVTAMVSQGLVALGMATSALAASEPAVRGAPPVEEIIVTARKRAESLQTVPVSAAVIGGAAIQNNAVASLQDLSATLPAITLAKGSTTDRLFIRGIGSGDNPSFEQSVGTFVDDVYHGRARNSQANLFDISRVEVLKGPQIIYFGNNAIAGAVNVTTQAPEPDFRVDIRALYNLTLENHTFEGALNVPLSDQIGLRLAGLVSGGDGWIEDFASDENAPETDNKAMRGTLLWHPSDEFSAKLKLQYADEHQRGGLPIVRRNCPPAAAFGAASGFCAAALAAPGPSGWFERSSTPGQQSGLTSREAVATLSYDAAGQTFTSVTAYTDYDYTLKTDLDSLPALLFSVSAPEDYEQVSQELRFDSKGEGALGYLAGIYYQHSRLNVRNDFNYAFLNARVAAAPAFAALLPYLPFGQSIRFHSTDTAASGFGALTWRVSPELRGTLAVRYSRVEKDFKQNILFGTAQSAYGPVVPFPSSVAPLAAAFARAGGLGVAGEIPLSRTDDQISPSLSVEYDVARNAMLYARYDNGFKAGGFNGVETSGDPSALPFSPESVDAYEVGLKSRWFDNSVTLNLDVFRSEYENLQLAGVVPSSTGAYVNRVQSAGGAVSQGVELEMAWEIDAQWRTNLSATALDARYTRYPNAPPTAAQTSAAQPFQDLGGEPILFGPDLSALWTLSWVRELDAKLELTISNQLYASSSYFLGFSNDPYLKQPGYAREDLSVTLASTSGWEVSVIGKNLGDIVIRTYGAALPTSLGSYVFITEPPRNVSVQFKYHF